MGLVTSKRQLLVYLGHVLKEFEAPKKTKVLEAIALSATTITTLNHLWQQQQQ